MLLGYFSLPQKHNISRILTFFEVKITYISSSDLKTSEFSRVCSTSKKYDVFNSQDQMYFIFTEKNVTFLFILFFL